MDWRCAAVVALIVPAVSQVSDISFERLTPDVTIAVDLEPGAVVGAEGLWVPQRSAQAIVRIRAGNASVDKPIPLGKAPCASIVTMVEEVVVPTCDPPALVRVDVRHGNASAPMPLAAVTPDSPIAAAARSVWTIADAKGIVTRVDQAVGTAVAEVYVARKPYAIAAGEDALWVTSEEGNLVTRIDPNTNLTVETIKVGPRPGPIAVGEGGVWTLNRGDGSVTRIDAKTNKVVATIPVGEGVAAGTIAAGEGAVWLSARGTPLVRIDPRTNRVTHRFSGAAGGVVLAGHGSLWVSAGPKMTWRLDPKLVAAMRP
jgi:YVTN family beta-propeller protein